MNIRYRVLGVMGSVVVSCCLAVSSVLAQTFTSGSTGALGAFNPDCNPKPCTAPLVVLPPDGVLHYTTVTIPANVTVKFQRNAANTPVTMLATGDVLIIGTLDVNGEHGKAPTGASDPTPPSEGGPGGFRGGHAGAGNGAILPGNGQGPGGGVYIPDQGSFGVFGPANSGVTGTYGAPNSFVSLLPLFGGSGGSGSVHLSPTQAGYSGAGGGGAIVIASSTKITLDAGLITAQGGSGHIFAINDFFCGIDGGAGSGGAVRLVAPHITGTGGTIRVTPGGVICATRLERVGRVRLEAFSYAGFSATTDPPMNHVYFPYSQVTTPGPVVATSNPALINLPVLNITSIGGIAPPALPMASYGTADVSLPPGAPSTVTVSLAASNIPVGTIFRVQAIPKNGVNITVNSSASVGAFSSSTASATLSLPVGQVVVITADATNITLPLLSKLLPTVEGEEVEQVMVAAAYGEPSSARLVTKSGKEVQVSQLSKEDQLKVATAFEAMQSEMR